MKINITDRVVDLLHERRRLVTNKLYKQYKGTKPFRMQPMSNDEALYHYNQLTPEKMFNLIQTYGRDTVNEMVFQMEKLKARRPQNA